MNIIKFDEKPNRPNLIRFIFQIKKSHLTYNTLKYNRLYDNFKN